jgi:hypothetical protein
MGEVPNSVLDQQTKPVRMLVGIWIIGLGERFARSQENIRFLIRLIIACLVIFCLACITLSVILRPSEQSSWFGDDTRQVEIGPRSKVTVPSRPDEVLDVYDPVVTPSGLLALSPISMGAYFPSGERLNCEYNGEPMLTIGEISVRIWKCSPKP